MVNETIIAGAPTPMPRGEEPGTWIGPYCIVRRLGEGGFGAVFEAEQDEPVRRRALDGSRRVSGDDHPDTLYTINNLAVLLRRRGDVEQSERLFREGLERSQRTLGQEHPLTRNFNQKLGQLLTGTGRVEEAGPFLRAAQEPAHAPTEN